VICPIATANCSNDTGKTRYQGSTDAAESIYPQHSLGIQGISVSFVKFWSKNFEVRCAALVVGRSENRVKRIALRANLAARAYRTRKHRSMIEFF